MARHLSPQDDEHCASHSDEVREEALREVFLSDAADTETRDEDHGEQPNQLQRLTTWMLAITVGMFSLPVAAALVVINLLRGEDMRLSAQALSLTGLFIALNSSGMLTNTLAMLPI